MDRKLSAQAKCGEDVTNVHFTKNCDGQTDRHTFEPLPNGFLCQPVSLPQKPIEIQQRLKRIPPRLPAILIRRKNPHTSHKVLTPHKDANYGILTHMERI